jgi:hypothetical protein
MNYLAETSTLVEKLPILSLLMIETVVWKSVAIFVRVQEAGDLLVKRPVVSSAYVQGSISAMQPGKGECVAVTLGRSIDNSMDFCC